MGFCAQPTPDMDGWSVEVRSESFYLVPSGPERVWAYGEGRHPRMLELSLRDIPALQEALAQAQRVHERGSEFEWVREVDGEVLPVPSIPAPRTCPVLFPAERLVSAARSCKDEPVLREGIDAVLFDPSEVPLVLVDEFLARVSVLDSSEAYADVHALADVLGAAAAAARSSHASAVRAALGQGS